MQNWVYNHFATKISFGQQGEFKSGIIGSFGKIEGSCLSISDEAGSKELEMVSFYWLVC